MKINNKRLVSMMIAVMMLPDGGSYSMMTGFSMGLMSMGSPSMAAEGYAGVQNILWSMEQYKAALDGEEQKEAWDELEKSIVANIADDAVVGVKKDRIDMTITWRAA